MPTTTIDLNDGGDSFTDWLSVTGPTGSLSRADTLSIEPNETLASMTQRAYGANTSELRSKILHANGNLDGATVGEIRAPR